MIDANQQRFWMLSQETQFDLSADDVTWDEEKRVVRMRSLREPKNLPADRVAVKNLLKQQDAFTLDEFGTWAGTYSTKNRIGSNGAFHGIDWCHEIDSEQDPGQSEEEMRKALQSLNTLHEIPIDEEILDLALGMDDVLYVLARTDQEQYKLYLIYLLVSQQEGKILYQGYEPEQYASERVKQLQFKAGEKPDRLVALAQGGALLVERDSNRFWQVIGTPMRDQPKALYNPATPRPEDEFAERQRIVTRADLLIPDNLKIIAMASNPRGQVGLLLYPDPDDSRLLAQVMLIADDSMSAPVALDYAFAPFSIGWVDGDDWAFLFKDQPQAIAYRIPFTDTSPQQPIKPLGHRYPLNWGMNNEYKNRVFVNSLAEPVHYLSSDQWGGLIVKPLHRLSYPAYAKSALTASSQVIDSGTARTAWHRIYLEAHLAKGTGVMVHLAAADDPDQLDEAEWMEHQFGAVPAKPQVPKANWIEDASEVPFHPGLLYCKPQPQIAGLFSVLIQRPGYNVRTLSGRYLKVKIELLGNGHASPELAAIRFYGPRFSYLNAYLPELYKETQVRQYADKKATDATGSDFLQRYLCLFESLLTPWEDKISSSYMLTNPQSAPSDALDWLASWIDATADIDLTESRKRRFIAEATELYRWRGTVKGLEMMLDIALDDAVSDGQIVLLEDFRLRRTFATILGADLSIDNDPLLMGKIPNANSYIGDSLILGDREQKEFMALYSSDVIEARQAEDVVHSFYQRLANRLTVLVHKHHDKQDLKLIRKIIAMEIPAHLDFRIVAASKPLLVGLYSLVGVDSYLRDRPERRFARAGYSYLGRNDFIKRLPVLDDRLEP